ARPETRVFRSAGDVGAEFLGEGSVHRRDVDAHLLEYAATHDRHHAAAALGLALARRPFPGAPLEAAGRIAGERPRLQLVFQPLERGADPVPQLLEPTPRALLSVAVVRHLPSTPREIRRSAGALRPAPSPPR